LGTKREDMRVYAMSKGKVAGKLKVSDDASNEDNAKMLDLSYTGKIMDIPGESVSSMPNIENSGATFILLVEKDTVFARLVDDKIWNHLPCIIITGCGVPDLATRAYLYHLHHKLKLPVVALVDCNPYGIQILLTYALGSKFDRNRWAIPSISWIGLHTSDIQKYNVSDATAQQMTSVDIRKGISILEKNSFVKENTNSLANLITDELTVMVNNGHKYEIEALHSLGLNFLSTRYLPDKINFLFEANVEASDPSVASLSTKNVEEDVVNEISSNEYIQATESMDEDEQYW
jgi:meiotic recombination protein SPO11